MSVLYIGGHAYRRERQMIGPNAYFGPDDKWTHLDRAGHEHYWTFAGKRGAYDFTTAELPTLRFVVDGEEWWEDSEEPHQYGHYECPQCGERIVPGQREHVEYMAGLTSYYIDDEAVSEERFMSEAKAAIAAYEDGKNREGIGSELSPASGKTDDPLPKT